MPWEANLFDVAHRLDTLIQQAKGDSEARAANRRQITHMLTGTTFILGSILAAIQAGNKVMATVAEDVTALAGAVTLLEAKADAAISALNGVPAAIAAALANAGVNLTDEQKTSIEASIASITDKANAIDSATTAEQAATAGQSPAPIVTG